MTKITNEEMENEMRFKASRPTTEIMTHINEEDRKAIEDKALEYAMDHSSAPDKETPDWIITDFKRGAEFGYHLRDEEVERLRKENEELRLDSRRSNVNLG